MSKQCLVLQDAVKKVIAHARESQEVLIFADVNNLDSGPRSVCCLHCCHDLVELWLVEDVAACEPQVGVNERPKTCRRSS